MKEDDEGPADNGPWWTVGGDWRKLVEDSSTQEEPQWWPASLVVDMDSGEEWECELQYFVHGRDDVGKVVGGWLERTLG